MEALYEEQRNKDLYIQRLLQVIQRKQEEIVELYHERHRMVEQTKRWTGQELIKHLTLDFSTQTVRPETCEQEVQNVPIQTD